MYTILYCPVLIYMIWTSNRDFKICWIKSWFGITEIIGTVGETGDQVLARNDSCILVTPVLNCHSGKRNTKLIKNIPADIIFCYDSDRNGQTREAHELVIIS